MSFASFPLEKLGLAPAQLAACQQAGYSVAADVLLPSASDLNKKLRFPRTQQVHDLIRDVSRAIAPSSSRVSELIPESSSTTGGGLRRGTSAAPSRGGASGARARGEDGWIRTGDEGLDQLLGGGLRIGCVTEITGESAAGKSHLCLCLAISAQLPALTARPGGTVVLTSERELATERLVELSRSFIATHARDEFVTSKMMLDNIQTTRCGDIEALDHALSYVLPAALDARRGKATEGASEPHSPLMGFRPRRLAESTARQYSASSASRNGGGEGVSRSGSGSTSASAATAAAAMVFSRSKPMARPVRLLVIDSITALLRGAETSFSSTSAGLTQRSRHLCLIADKLKALAVEYELAVLVINQVSDVFSRPYSAAVPVSSSSSRPSSPASGSASAGMSSQRQSAVGTGQWTASQHPGHSQAFYTEGDDPPMRYATQARWFSGQSRLLAKEASLGIVWANAINTRIMLSRTGRRRMLDPQDLSAVKRRRAIEDEDGDGETEAVTHGFVAADIKPTLIRRAHLVFSPFAPPGTIDFAITPSGVHTLRDSYKLDEAGDAIRARTRAAMRRRQHEASDGHEEVDAGEITGRAARTRADDGDRGAGDDDGPNGVGDDDDEFGGDVFDDFGELPPEFWDGTWETRGTGDGPLATGVGVT